jgi:dTDP-4-amino-4,6-dideoxygalactose transaminase
MADRRSYRIRFQAPEIPSSERIEGYFQLSRESRWFSNRGPCQELLERRIVGDLGGRVFAVPVSNATTGLMVAIRALASLPAERPLVIVPSYTFVATVSAITWAGFHPLFVDVDPDSWHIDPDAVVVALAAHPGRVAVILACSTFGVPQPAELVDRLFGIAAGAGVPLLVDSAAGYGSARPDGSRPECDGDLEVYSFHATKPFAIGEGGLIVARDQHLANRVASLANFGFDETRDVAGDIGLNAKLDEWHCATALAVLDKFPEVIAARRSVSTAAKRALEPYGFTSQHGAELACSQFISILAPTSAVRDGCRELARTRGIEMRAYYEHPLHLTPTLRTFPQVGNLPVTTELAARTLSLPLANDTSEADLREVIQACVDAAMIGLG